MTAGSDNLFPKVIHTMQTSDPAAPSDSTWKTYAKAGGIYARSSNAVVGPFAAAGVGGGGSFVWLQTQTASASATLDFTSFISSTYDDYLFKFINILPATSTAIFQMRVGTGGGPTYDTGANYGSQIFRHSHNASAASGADSGATSIALTTAWLSTGVHGIGGSLELYDPQSTALNKYVSGKFVYPDSGISNMVVSEQGGQWNTSGTAATAVRFFMSSGNITSGVIRVYGIAKA